MFDDDTDEQLPKAKPVMGWPGGKGRLLKHILPHITKHMLYVEPFGGGLAVFAAKPRSEIEVINDINGDLISFYRCCKFHLDALLDKLDLVQNSRQEIDDYRKQRGLTEIQRAARFYIINVLSFGGTMTGFRVMRTGAMPSRSNKMLAIRALNHRLDRTTIEHVSWDKCIDLYDHPEGFFFMDPPYLDAGGGAYAGWSEHELQRFCTRVKKMKSAWMVTFQDCDAIRDLLRDYTIRAIKRPNGIGNKSGKKGRVYREVFITSEQNEFAAERKVSGA